MGAPTTLAEATSSIQGAVPWRSNQDCKASGSHLLAVLTLFQVHLLDVGGHEVPTAFHQVGSVCERGKHVVT